MSQAVEFKVDHLTAFQRELANFELATLGGWAYRLCCPYRLHCLFRMYCLHTHVPVYPPAHADYFDGLLPLLRAPLPRVWETVEGGLAVGAALGLELPASLSCSFPMEGAWRAMGACMGPPRASVSPHLLSAPPPALMCPWCRVSLPACRLVAHLLSFIHSYPLQKLFPVMPYHAMPRPCAGAHPRDSLPWPPAHRRCAEPCGPARQVLPCTHRATF